MNRWRSPAFGISAVIREPSALAILFLLLALVGGSSLPSAVGASQGGASGTQQGDFFIVSSVDVGKNQIVLKLPTEVTELMLVTEDTVFLNEQGKPMQFQQLRAGDTVYVVAKTAADGTHMARRIRRGPMTIEELRRRYLSGAARSGA